MRYYHKPVLLNEVLDILSPKPSGIYVDATLGGGGHFENVIEYAKGKGTFIGIDQDEDSIENAKTKFSKVKADIKLIHDNFYNIKKIMESLNIDGIDGILFDLGVSSFQLDNKARGFSYMGDAPLDMRMDRTSGKTAYDVVNFMSRDELKKIIKEYGEELWAGRIANFICNRRKDKKIKTTGELVDIIKAAIPARSRRKGAHPAKRTFQAIRIYVNNELGILDSSIKDAVKLLNPRGRICVITFHSLEDRIIKNVFKELSTDCICSKELPICVCNHKKTIELITKKPIQPTETETGVNPRSRSAKLRTAEKL